MFAAQSATSSLIQGRPISWQWDVIHELVYFGVWGLCTPIIAGQARRHWLESGVGPGPWLAHLATALVLAPLQVSVTYLLHGLGLVAFGAIAAGEWAGWMRARAGSVVALSFTGVLYYWVVLGVYYAAAYRRLYLTQRAETAQASLDALRARLEPHFLFNTLNSVSVLTEQNPKAASRVLLRLSELLRTVLRQEPRHETSLAQEVAVLEHYLEIQRLRFEDRLRVSVEIAPETAGGLVPWLVLQPLVENAIRYAVEPRAGGGRIAVRAARRGETLHLSVEDDGPGFDGGVRGPPGNGVGVANTRARLARLYGDRHRFRMAGGPDGGCRVEIELPFRESR